MNLPLVKTEQLDAPAPLATADELRRHLFAVYERTDDAFLEVLIKAATTHTETVTWRKLVSQQWRLYLDSWPDGDLLLPYGTVSEVTLFRYLDGEAADHELVDGTDYLPAIIGPEPCIKPIGSWPSDTLFDVDSIRVEFTAGYGAPDEVPTDIKHAVLMLAAHWYENRETVIVGTTVRNVPFAYEALIGPYKLRYA